jgi:outer membrane protein assembly factor BamA
LTLLVAAWLSAVAFAADPEEEAGPPDTPEGWGEALTSHAGQLVAFVTIAAPRGGLGREPLDPLLRVRQDGLFRPGDVRQDVDTLFRAGEFAQVEAWLEPWPVLLPDGEQVEGVRMEYRVYPQPRITKLAVTGARAVPPPELLARLGLAEGDVWARDDLAALEAAVAAAYLERGWPEAHATLARTFNDDGDVELRFDVVEGAPRRVAEIRVRPTAALTAAEARAILARNGLRVGRPWTDTALRAAQEAVVKRLHDYPVRLLWWRRAWWPEARVNLKVVPTEGGDRVSLLVEERRPWTIELADETKRRDLPDERALVETMGLDGGARLRREFAEEGSAELNDAAALEGFVDTKVEVRVDEADDHVRLTISGDRGPRYALRRVRSTGDVIDPAAIGAATRGGFYGCETGRGYGAEPRAEARVHARADRFLCQATAESAGETLRAPAFQRQTITPEAAERAASDLAEFYRSQGFRSVKVERTRFERIGPPHGRVQAVEVGYTVTAGPRVRLSGVTVSGAAPGVAGSALFADLLGKPLNPNTIAERTRRIVEQHQERGFLHADARVTTTVDDAGTGATLAVVVTPGPIVLVRSVVIRGHSRTRRHTIQRPIALAAGDPVSPRALADVRRELYELGAFSRVSVEAEGDEDRLKDIVVSVDEKHNLAFEAGGGLATDNGAAVFLRARHRNLGGLAHRIALYGQAGVGWLGDGWTPDWVAPEWKAGLRYEAPNLPTLGERVSVDVLFNEEQQERSYRIERSGGSVGVRLRLGRAATAELGYRAQYRRLLDVDPGVLVAGDAWADELAVADLGDPVVTLPSAGRWASGIEASFVLDLRDDEVQATRGGLGSVSLRVNDDLVSDLAFVRAEGSWTQLLPVGGFGLVLRARGGLAGSPDGTLTLPIEDRFSAGGGGSFRGFDVDQVGPANHVGAEAIGYPDAVEPIVDFSQRGATGRWVPTGGDSMAIGTVELDVPFTRLGLPDWGAWQLAFFGDVGNVWWLSDAVTTDSMERGTDPLVRFGTGVGLRRSTPIGPLQLDLGFNPAPLAYRDEIVARVHFAVGAL